MIKRRKFENLFLIKNKTFKDSRGYFKEIIRENKIKAKFPFFVMSYSRKNVIRGIHVQMKKSQGKFITVIKGKIFDVAIDLRKNSKTFGKTFTCTLSEKNSNSIFIPAGFAHGFLCLSKNCAVYYKCTNYRDQNSEKTIKWNDKNLNINWPIKKPILSQKDSLGINFKDF